MNGAEKGGLIRKNPRELHMDCRDENELEPTGPPNIAVGPPLTVAAILAMVIY